MTNGNVPGHDSSRLKLHFEWLKELLCDQRQIAEKRKNKLSAESIRLAATYVAELEKREEVIDITDLLQEAIAFVKKLALSDAGGQDGR